MTPLVPVILVLLQIAGTVPQAFTYKFDEVKRSVFLWPGGDPRKEAKASQGGSAAAGDVVRTGWLGQTVLSVPERNARFEVFANSQVKLAGEEPGVLLILNRGRLKAIFQALIEGSREDRRIAVPGALLAVRGTKYGVEVDKNGKSILVVFEGVVEVLRHEAQTGPTLVKAGEWTAFGPGMAPKVEPMRMRGFGERTWSQGMRPDGSMAPGSMSPGASMPKGMGSGPGHMHH